MKHKREHLQSSLDQTTVADLVRFLLWLSADKSENVIDLLRAIQDRRWYEIWAEPIVFGDVREQAYVTQMQFAQQAKQAPGDEPGFLKRVIVHLHGVV